MRLGPRPSSRALATVALALLLATAGCSGLTGTPTPETSTQTTTPTAAPTATPAATPSPTATPTATATATPSSTPTLPPTDTARSVALPAGVTADGVANASRVVATHQQNLVRTPGRLAHTTNTTVAGDPLRTTTTAVATSNLSAVRYETVGRLARPNATRNSTTVIYANQTAVRQYAVVNGNVTLNNTRNRTDTFDVAVRGLSTGVNPLRGLLQRGNFTVASVSTVNGTEVVTLRAEEYAGGRLYDPENVGSYEATVRITADGTVRSASEHIVGTDDARRAYYHFDLRFASSPVTPDPVDRG
ncbi:hypothetical protein N0B31_14330 [Salinirubellus salinus]|uniref:Uncharacterized protein n=1 Tax=Salinirubellus salinus TaxID=1364945 RepID=A0A9E7U9Y2_9EURY|nr:hypothetical protein [Salinirubellus salinus]UWM53314.1 hypothetical protein N0B31_14330 [Salinirubellus salinus]